MPAHLTITRKFGGPTVMQAFLESLHQGFVVTVFQVFIQDLGEDSPNLTIVNKTVLRKGMQYHLENGDIVVS